MYVCTSYLKGVGGIADRVDRDHMQYCCLFGFFVVFCFCLFFCLFFSFLFCAGVFWGGGGSVIKLSITMGCPFLN